MGSTPSRQSDDFPKHMDEPFAGNGFGENVLPAPGLKQRYPTSSVVARIKKNSSRNPGTKVSWSTTSIASEEVQTHGGCKDQEPSAAANDASIQ